MANHQSKSERAERRARADATAQFIETLIAMGASVSNAGRRNMYVIRYRGAVIDLWPSGLWRPRMVGVHCTVTRTDGRQALLDLLRQEQLPEWMTRRAV